MTLKPIIAAGLVLAVPLGVASRAPQLTHFEFSEPHMGTIFRIVLFAPDEAAAQQASAAAFGRITALDDTMSDYNPQSELMLLCGHAAGPPVVISGDLFRVLEKSQDVAEKSGGAFDVTVGPLVQLWRRARRQHELPDPESLARALRLVGHEKLLLDPRARTAQLLKPGMQLDLGGIGKGYAADEAIVVLKRHGIARALIAAGGDVVTGSPPPGKAGWRIGIASLEMPEKSPTRFISLHDAAGQPGHGGQRPRSRARPRSHQECPGCFAALRPGHRAGRQYGRMAVSAAGLRGARTRRFKVPVTARSRAIRARL
ncbi:MAG: thiamine biosynthesis protein ApbE [Acidobacteria bacterium]|nr:MAG: thiamine biosynthesis protein ApbE [Acidobacteriota bacterium]